MQDFDRVGDVLKASFRRKKYQNFQKPRFYRVTTIARKKQFSTGLIQKNAKTRYCPCKTLKVAVILVYKLICKIFLFMARANISAISCMRSSAVISSGCLAFTGIRKSPLFVPIYAGMFFI